MKDFEILVNVGQVHFMICFVATNNVPLVGPFCT